MLTPFIEMIGGYGTLQGVAVALLLGSARLLGLMLTFPVFTQSQIEGTTRFTVAALLSLPVIMSVFPDVQTPASIGWFRICILLIKELMVGLFLGLVLALPFWGLQALGDLVDQSRGASQANVSDPINASETTILGQTLLIAAILLFAVTDGLVHLLGVVFDSFKAWPVLSLNPPPTLDLVVGLGRFLGEVIRLGFILGTPLLLMLFIIDLTLGFIGRMAQQLQVNDMSNSLKNLMVVLLLPFVMTFFVSYTLPQLQGIGSIAKRLFSFQ